MELQKSYQKQVRHSKHGGEAGGTTHCGDDVSREGGEMSCRIEAACCCGEANACYNPPVQAAHRVLVDACVTMVVCDVMWVWCNAPYMTMWAAHLTNSQRLSLS